jgi:glutamine---fructose-6-phosphate transaminase (isomerizing)
MCGIFGVVGSNQALIKALAGIKLLEYRGYDSAGVATLDDNEIFVQKESGKIAFLEKNLGCVDSSAKTAIAHTRWATHGGPTSANAHPHTDTNKEFAVVHNGIIENYHGIRALLKKEGIHFHSETDTEVIPHLLSKYYKGNTLLAVQQTKTVLEGSFAVVFIHKQEPEVIYAFTKESPLVIGHGEGVGYVASDQNALPISCKEVIYLDNHQIARITPSSVTVFDKELKEVIHKKEPLNNFSEKISKGKFSHFTLKEIHDQPYVMRKCLEGHIDWELGTADFKELTHLFENLRKVDNILILGCGTSWHSGCVASYMFEDCARLATRVEIASEFRYKNPVIGPNTFVIAVSQSGETADTIAAVRELKGKGVKIIAICNVEGSTLVREAHATLFLHAGPEIGVCSTKAFTNQLLIFNLLALYFGRMRHMSKAQGQYYIEALKRLPEQVEHLLYHANEIEKIAKKYAHYSHFFYLGRRYMYPTALEGALKLKEISYIDANGYPAGEMKHGPIALISKECPTVAFCSNRQTYEKMLSNLQEVKARAGKVIAIAEQEQFGLEDIADDIIRIPETIDEYAPVIASVAAQLFAFFVACERGADIDQPRNLAKSVTVE